MQTDDRELEEFFCLFRLKGENCNLQTKIVLAIKRWHLLQQLLAIAAAAAAQLLASGDLQQTAAAAAVASQVPPAPGLAGTHCPGLARRPGPATAVGPGQ